MTPFDYDYPLISIIVPVYNTGEYLTKCVESLIHQTYPNIEIILVDDGSTDQATIAICDEIDAENQSVRLIRKANGGASSARNAGICAANGEYIGFVDSDDFVEPEMYLNLVENAQTNNTKISIGGMVIDGYRKMQRPVKVRAGKLSSSEALHYYLLGYWHSSCTNIYHCSLFRNATFPLGETNEDFIFNFKMLSLSDTVYVDKRAFYHYVKRTGSATTSTACLNNLDWPKHVDQIESDLRNSGRYEQLSDELEFQSIFCAVVLSNKALMDLARGPHEEAEAVFLASTNRIRNLKAQVIKNKYLHGKYRAMALALTHCPAVYRNLVTFVLRAKGAK